MRTNIKQEVWGTTNYFSNKIVNNVIIAFPLQTCKDFTCTTAAIIDTFSCLFFYLINILNVLENTLIILEIQ